MQAPAPARLPAERVGLLVLNENESRVLVAESGLPVSQVQAHTSEQRIEHGVEPWPESLLIHRVVRRQAHEEPEIVGLRPGRSAQGVSDHHAGLIEVDGDLLRRVAERDVPETVQARHMRPYEAEHVLAELGQAHACRPGIDVLEGAERADRIATFVRRHAAPVVEKSIADVDGTTHEADPHAPGSECHAVRVEKHVVVQTGHELRLAPLVAQSARVAQERRVGPVVRIAAPEGRSAGAADARRAYGRVDGERDRPILPGRQGTVRPGKRREDENR